MQASAKSSELSPAVSVYEFDAPDAAPLFHEEEAGGFVTAVSTSSLSMLKSVLERFVLPAMRRSHALHTQPLVACPWSQELRKFYHFPSSVVAELTPMRTHDGAHLDTILVAPQSFQSKAMAERSYIVRFNGNGSLYEDNFASMARHAQALQQGVIGFNYRGVGRSTPRPTRSADLIYDGIAQVGALIKAGVPSHAITLHGYSLGGAIATYVAAYFHKHGYPVRLFNERSFSSLSQVALETMGVLGSWSARLMVKTGWEMQPTVHYQAIPAAYKMAIVANADQRIPLASSLAAAIGGSEPTVHRVAGDHNQDLQDLAALDENGTAEGLLYELVRRTLP